MAAARSYLRQKGNGISRFLDAPSFLSARSRNLTGLTRELIDRAVARGQSGPVLG